MIERKTIIIDNQETNYEVSSDGKVFNKKTGRELKGTYARNEYHSVQLTINGKPKTLMTHRLVAEAFCDNPNHYTIVDHIDRNKHNNIYTNLRWTNESGNAKNVEDKKSAIIQIYTGNFDELNIEWKVIKEKYKINNLGMIVNTESKQILSGHDRNGYKRMMLLGKSYSLHKLLWESFMGPIPEGMVLDHIDGDRSNNDLTNLRLVSQSENMLNAQINGHKGQVKISQYDENGTFIAHYNSIREAANQVNGSEYAITQAAERYGKSAGYFWIKDNQNITIDEVLKITHANKLKVNSMGVNQYSDKGDFINHYDTLKAASEEVQCASSTIKRAADNQRLGKGYYWILDNQNIKIEDILK